jgi:hypothetical protein
MALWAVARHQDHAGLEHDPKKLQTFLTRSCDEFDLTPFRSRGCPETTQRFSSELPARTMVARAPNPLPCDPGACEGRCAGPVEMTAAAVVPPAAAGAEAALIVSWRPGS